MVKDLHISLIGDDLVRATGVKKSALRRFAKQCRADSVWLEVVDGVEDFVVQFDPIQLSPEEAMHRLSVMTINDEAVLDGEDDILTLDVVFGGEDGPDIENVCETLGISENALIEAVCDAELQVDIVGFTPGFAYISGLPEFLNVPRHAQPRTRVPAGSFGLAAGKCGTYALEGPGGWPLIGRVRNVLFDHSRSDPFVLVAGQKLRVRRVKT